jgi:hypothetical protein
MHPNFQSHGLRQHYQPSRLSRWRSAGWLRQLWIWL